jgi:hypothetical protein
MEILYARATCRIVLCALLLISLPIAHAQVSNEFQRQQIQSCLTNQDCDGRNTQCYQQCGANLPRNVEDDIRRCVQNCEVARKNCHTLCGG